MPWPLCSGVPFDLGEKKLPWGQGQAPSAPVHNQEAGTRSPLVVPRRGPGHAECRRTSCLGRWGHLPQNKASSSDGLSCWGWGEDRVQPAEQKSVSRRLWCLCRDRPREASGPRGQWMLRPWAWGWVGGGEGARLPQELQPSERGSRLAKPLAPLMKASSVPVCLSSYTVPTGSPGPGAPSEGLHL